jgi:bifunctional DNase/RNase
MEKVELFVLGLTSGPATNNAFALILKELDGERRLPIIIGAYEAQAIVIELDGITPPRPMTHDLFKNLIDVMDLSLTEVNITELQDGTFYANLYFENGDIEIDARPSDAIAIAIRMQVPIFVSSDILDEVGVIGAEEDNQIRTKAQQSPKVNKSEKLSSIDKIKVKLDNAINDEDYELAAQLRDEMNKFLGNS